MQKQWRIVIMPLSAMLIGQKLILEKPLLYKK
jgi:hypothetical protein